MKKKCSRYMNLRKEGKLCWLVPFKGIKNNIGKNETIDWKGN